MKRAALLAIVLCSAVSVRAEILLRGLLIADGSTRFSLYSTDDRTSKWVSVGQSFAGYAVAEYRPNQDVLVLKKGEAVIELRMLVTKIASTGSISTDERDRTAALEELLKKPIRDLPISNR